MALTSPLGALPGLIGTARPGTAGTVGVSSYPAPVGTRPPPAAPGVGGTPAQRDAFARISAVLDTYGLPRSLAQWAWSELLTGATPDSILIDLRQRPEWAARFPGNIARQKAGLPIYSEAEYVAYERALRELEQQTGMPKSFIDNPTVAADLIAGGTSLSELHDRLVDGFAAAQAAPQETRAALARLYGIGAGGLAAYFIDPDRALPLIQKQWAASTAASAAQRTGFGALDIGQAERVASFGVSDAQAVQGFAELQRGRELYQALPGETGADTINTDALIAAEFGGDVQTQEQIGRRARRRQAAFQQGGGLQAGKEGISGLGTAAT